MNLIQRYIYAVEQHLPETVRQDVGRELQANIEDQLEAQTDIADNHNESQQVGAILKQLGHPAQIAARYHRPPALVSGVLMPLYFNVLGLALGLVFVLHVLDLSLGYLAATEFNLIRFLLQLSFGFIDTATWIFTAVTLGFYAISATGTEEKWLGYQQWDPQKLPDIGRPWQNISIGNILTELATNIFLIVVLWQPLWRSAESMAQANFAFSAEFRQTFVLITGLLILSSIFNLWCLRSPYWTRLTLALNIAQNLIFSAVLVYIAWLPGIVVKTEATSERIFGIEQLNSGISTGLVLVALFLLYEVCRDTWRLRSLTD